MHRYHWRHLVRQVLHLTWASLKSRYRKTLAGFLWVLLNPLVMLGVQSLVFKKFLRLEIPNFYVFLISGLLPWIFMNQTIQMGTPSLVTNGAILKSFKFHPMVLVASATLDNFINFILSIILIAVPALIFTDSSLTGLLFAPICLLPFLIGTFSITLFTSLLNVFFRDTNFVLSFLFSILFFVTPIFYPISYIPLSYRWMADFNPLYQFIIPFRLALYSEIPFDWFRPWLTSMVWALSFSLLSFYYWKRKINAIYINL